jgi:hypothetical protein
MPKQINNFIKGRVGNLVFQEFRGKQGVRTLGDTSKRTAGSERSSNRFGIGQRCGATLRWELAPAIPFPKDKSMQGYFGGAITKWIAATGEQGPVPQTALSFLQDFSFNSLTNIRERWKVNLLFSQSSLPVFQLLVPGFVPKDMVIAPANTAKLLCTIATAACSLPDGILTGSHHFSYEMPYNNQPVAAQLLDIPVSPAEGSLLVTAVRLQYILANGRETGNKKFMPASVADARFV